MTTLITNPARHRAQIVAEAVVSAYIHEIAQPQPRPRLRLGEASENPVPVRRLTAPVAPRSRPRSHPLTTGRRRAPELAA